MLVYISVAHVVAPIVMTKVIKQISKPVMSKKKRVKRGTGRATKNLIKLFQVRKIAEKNQF